VGLCSALLFGTAAQAQSFPDWVSASGRIAFGVTDRLPGADVFLAGDVQLRFAPQIFGRFGAELGMFGRADALDTPHETYGAITYDFGENGRVSVGVPRPAFDGFAVSALEKSFPALGVDRAATTRSAVTHGAMFANWLPFGVTFANQTDTLRYAVSLHDVGRVDTTVASLGAATDIGDWQISGALEVTFGTSTEVSGKIQAKGQVGAVNVGAGYYVPGIFGSSDMVEVFADFSPIDRVTISGVVQLPTDGATDPTGGIAMRYDLTAQSAISLGVASDAGSGAVLSTFLNWTF